MPRPRQCRFVERTPHAVYFKPRGIPMSELRETGISVEGLEALRLADLEGLTATEAARCMRISRHTFGRLLAETRRNVADALVHGKALHIGGGTFAVLSSCAPSTVDDATESPTPPVTVPASSQHD